MDDFRKYATKHLGMNGMVLDDVIKSQAGYLNPYILEERQLNVTQLDVFSRLMMDRIIFLGTQVDDYTANTLQAQLLYLDSVDPGKDISIYINSPGGSVYAGLGIYDTMQFISSDVATICTGMAASMAAVLLVAGAEGNARVQNDLFSVRFVRIRQPHGQDYQGVADLLGRIILLAALLPLLLSQYALHGGNAVGGAQGAEPVMGGGVRLVQVQLDAGQTLQFLLQFLVDIVPAVPVFL